MKFTRAQCQPVVDYLLKGLRPWCEMLEVAGSWRRQCDLMSDLEFVFVPKIVQETDGLLGLGISKTVSAADRQIETWLKNGVIEKRLAENGRISSWGPNNKHAIHVDSEIPVDFFCEPDARDWFRTLVIRTGSKTFNVALMATAPKVGIIPHAYGEAFFKANGERVFANSEQEVLQICGIPWTEPKDR